MELQTNKKHNKIVLLKQLFHYMFEIIAVSYLSFRKVSSEFLFWKYMKQVVFGRERVLNVGGVTRLWSRASAVLLAITRVDWGG